MPLLAHLCCVLVFKSLRRCPDGADEQLPWKGHLLGPSAPLPCAEAAPAGVRPTAASSRASRPGTDGDACTFSLFTDCKHVAIHWGQGPRWHTTPAGGGGGGSRSPVPPAQAVFARGVTGGGGAGACGCSGPAPAAQPPPETPTPRLEQPSPGRACGASGEGESALPVQPVTCCGWNMAPLRQAQKTREADKKLDFARLPSGGAELEGPVSLAVLVAGWEGRCGVGGWGAEAALPGGGPVRVRRQEAFPGLPGHRAGRSRGRGSRAQSSRGPEAEPGGRRESLPSLWGLPAAPLETRTVS